MLSEVLNVSLESLFCVPLDSRVAVLLCALSVLGCSKLAVTTTDSDSTTSQKKEQEVSNEVVRYPGPTSELLYNVPPFEMTPADADEEEYNKITGTINYKAAQTYSPTAIRLQEFDANAFESGASL